MSQERDLKIKELMKIIADKESKLGDKPKFIPQTNCKFVFGLKDAYVNLNVTHDLHTCIHMMAYLQLIYKHWAEAQEILGVKSTFKHEGYTYEEWVADLKSRVSILVYNEESKKLAKLKDTLSELRSEEAKVNSTLEDIAVLLRG